MDILNISKSKTKKAILILFFSDINKKFYLRELERILGFSVANIRRELLLFEKTGLFHRKKIGNQVYYSLNKKSPIFSEIKKIISKTIGIEAILKTELKKNKDISCAFVFGSFAKNKETSNSDIDIMIIGNINEDYLITIVSKLEKILNREINYHLLSENEWKDGKDKNSFLKNIANGPKIEII